MSKDIHTLASMAAMMSMDPEMHAQMSELHQKMTEKTDEEIEQEIQLKPEELIEFMDQAIAKLEQKIKDWNDNSSHKLTSWNIYGYDLKGTTEHNAQKRLRKFQAEEGLVPGVTPQVLAEERERLQGLIEND